MSANNGDQSIPPARQIARLIAFVAMVGAGIGAVLSFSGRGNSALIVCAGSAGVGLAILLLGGLLVAANRPEK